MDISHITGLILAGGRGSRMGGVDKGLQSVHNIPMVRHVMATLAPQVGSLMISANRNLSAYATFGVPVWPDVNDDFAGPLAGIQAGLQNCQTPYLVTVPCDSPFLPDNIVSELATALENTAADIAVAATSGINSKIQTQPVFMLMKTTVLTDLMTFLNEGGRKIETWYRRLPYTEVLFPDAMPFRNINTPNELREADNH